MPKSTRSFDNTVGSVIATDETFTRAGFPPPHLVVATKVLAELQGESSRLSRHCEVHPGDGDGLTARDEVRDRFKDQKKRVESRF